MAGLSLIAHWSCPAPPTSVAAMSAMQRPQGHVLYHPGDECAGFVVVHQGTV